MRVEWWVRTSVPAHPKGCCCRVYKGATSPQTPRAPRPSHWNHWEYYLPFCFPGFQQWTDTVLYTVWGIQEAQKDTATDTVWGRERVNMLPSIALLSGTVSSCFSTCMVRSATAPPACSSSCRRAVRRSFSSFSRCTSCSLSCWASADGLADRWRILVRVGS